MKRGAQDLALFPDQEDDQARHQGAGDDGDGEQGVEVHGAIMAVAVPPASRAQSGAAPSPRATTATRARTRAGTWMAAPAAAVSLALSANAAAGVVIR